MSGWIGVDLDGTLAHYDGFVGGTVIGKPIPLMVERVKRWLEEGREVRIFTARISHEDPDDKRLIEIAIKRWCVLHLGEALAVTNVKDFGMVELYDDRAVQVIPNTGELVGKSTRGL